MACIDSKANVCSVQFSPVNSNLMAFGSANYRVYLYDLRNIHVRLNPNLCRHNYYWDIIWSEQKSLATLPCDLQMTLLMV